MSLTWAAKHVSGAQTGVGYMNFHRTLGSRTSKNSWYVPHTECLQGGQVASGISRPFDQENVSLKNGSWNWAPVKRSWENSLRLTALGHERGAPQTHTGRDLGAGQLWGRFGSGAGSFVIFSSSFLKFIFY